MANPYSKEAIEHRKWAKVAKAADDAAAAGEIGEHEHAFWHQVASNIFHRRTNTKPRKLEAAE